MKKVTSFCAVLLVVVFAAIAQNPLLDKANKVFEAKNYNEAIVQFKKAYAKEKSKAGKADIIFKTAECYRLTSATKDAEQWYQKAIKASYKDPIVFLNYADMLRANCNYTEAIIQYNAYKQKGGTDSKATDAIKACELSQKWKDHPSRFTVDPVSSINTKFSDFAASYSNAKKGYRYIIFTSAREEATGNNTDASWSGEKHTDLFEATLDPKKNKWSTPVPLAAPVSTAEKEGTSTITRKGTEMYFTRCPEGKNKVVICKIFYASKKGTTWSDPTILPFCEQDTFAYGYPSLSADESYLYFSSTREGGQGGHDIWVSQLDKKTKQWGEPINLGPTINTSEEEMSPFVHADGTLYFASNGHLNEGNMGGLDIYSAKFINNQWDKVTNLRSPLNSCADDFNVVWEDESEKGYFSSNRDGGKGGDDIYSFAVFSLLFTLQGQVTDIDTKQPLADSKVELFGSDGSAVSAITGKDGRYKFELKENRSYKITANKKNYLGAKAEESTIGIEESKDFVINFQLKTTSHEIVLPNIYYDLDKATLRPESKKELDGLVETLKDNATIVIELGSHTDTRASDDYNDKLSQARAQSVVDYLIAKGIEPDRLVARGYGERVPRVLQKAEKVNINGTDYSFDRDDKITDQFIARLKSNDEKEAAHQLNRRTEFKVLRDDYVPKSGSGATGNSGGNVPAEGSSVSTESSATESSSTNSSSGTTETTPSSSDTPAPVAETPAPAERYYVVKKGDTYAAVAQQYGFTEDDLKDLNDIKGGGKPKVGIKLKIVDDYIYHDVVKGDSFGKIAKQSGIKMDELMRMNNIKKGALIKEYIGKRLRVGVKK